MARNRRRGAKVAGLRKNGRNPNGGNPGSRREMIPHPPPFRTLNIRHSMTLRYISLNNLVGQLITYQNLMDCIAVATTGTVLFCVFNAVRIRKITMWDVGNSPAIVTITLIYNESDGVQSGDRAMHTDTSMGFSPAHLVAVPKKDSLTSKWHIDSSETAFTLWSSANCVIDVSLEYINNMNGGLNQCQAAGVGATPGVVYVRGLDGKPLATSNFFTPAGTIQI